MITMVQSAFTSGINARTLVESTVKVLSCSKPASIVPVNAAIGMTITKIGTRAWNEMI